MSAAQAPAEALTLERLLWAAAEEGNHRGALNRAAALLTPRAKLELAAELLAKVPGLVYVDVSMGAEAVALVRDLPGAVPVRFAHADHTTEGYTAQVGRFTVRATARRESTEEERQALADAAPERLGCVMLPATLDDARRLLEGGQ